LTIQLSRVNTPPPCGQGEHDEESDKHPQDTGGTKHYVHCHVPFLITRSCTEAIAGSFRDTSSTHIQEIMQFHSRHGESGREQFHPRASIWLPCGQAAAIATIIALSVNGHIL
jgi:hypothetical protein